MNKKGFTLIELLVVIAIIGLLSTLAVVALGSAREKANDSKRLSDLKQVQTALELFYTDFNHYPTSTAAITLGGASSDCLSKTIETGFLAKTSCGNNPYMGLVPEDPLSTQSYIYTPDTNGTTYTISATLQGTVSGLTGTVTATPSGIQ